MTSGWSIEGLDPVIELVKTVAREELLPRFSSGHHGGEGRLKNDGSLVTDADLAVQKRLELALQHLWPGYGFLAEEMTSTQQHQQLAAVGVGLWCLDPLDGTTNFSAGLPFFSLSLALIDPAGVVLGIVYDPVRDECFSALRGHGARLNGQRLHCQGRASGLSEAVALIDFKRLDTRLATALVQSPPFRSQRNMGSVALEWCWLAANRFDVYLHGRQKLWDFCAGSLILSEAGGCAATLTGEAVFQADRLECSVLAARDEPLFKQWSVWLRQQS